MQIVAVGKQLFENRSVLPESVEYNYQAGDHTLLISMRNLHATEIEAVSTGAAEFALFCENSVLFLLYRFAEALPWSDAAFSWWNLHDEDRRLPPAPELAEERALLKIILTEAATGVVKAIRVLTFSPEFTRKLHDAIHAQAADEPLPRAEFVRRSLKIYEQYKPYELAARAAVKTIGGA